MPFGEVRIVRDWLGIDGPVHAPSVQHPKRPIDGWLVKKSEVSGQRLWGLFRELAGRPQVFFANCLVYNYCPLCFVAKSGRNVAPNQLSVLERKRLTALCDQTMGEVLELLRPETAVGVGKWTEERLRSIRDERRLACRVVGLLHPSPMSPLANDFAATARKELDRLDLTRYIRNELDDESEVAVIVEEVTAKSLLRESDSAEESTKIKK